MNKTKKLLSLLLMITVLVGCAAQTAFAAVHNNVITSIQAMLQDGSGPVGDVGQWQVFRLQAGFALPNNTIHAGDTTVIKLPNKLKYAQTASFELKDGSGNVVANAVIDAAAKTVTLTYTNYAETHSDVTGSFYFYVKIDRMQVNGEEWIPLEIDVSGQTVVGNPIHFIGIPTPTGRPLNKSGWYASTQTDKRTIEFQHAVNTIGQAMNDVVITDELVSAAVTINPSSLRIYKGKWVAEHGDWKMINDSLVTNNYPISWNADHTSFTITLGNIGAADGFLINYQAVASYDLVDGEVIKNKAVLTGSNVNPYSVSANATYFEAGGSAEGYVFTIEILKQSEDGSTLAGAVFDVIRNSNNIVVGTATTDGSGKAKITGLLKDTYKLAEKTPPVGFDPLPTPLTITPDDFGSDKVARKTITNHPSKIDIPVAKTWVGPAAGPVTVQLKADGTAVPGKTLELNEANGWTATFTDLNEYKNGQLIVYTVEESNPPAGYTPAVTGTPADGFTVTNTNTETVSIPVTKTWVGPAAGPVTVQLKADGAAVPGKTLELTEAGSWTGSFAGLPKYHPNGTEIVYTVEEPHPPAGYTPAVTGTPADGFTVTNTNTETVSIPVVKTWVGPAAGPVTVQLKADGAAVPGKTLELTEAGSWTGSFAGLPKYHPNGTEIVYTVEEPNPPAGYTPAVTGTPADGFTITNTNTETVDVPVTKTWVGPGLTKVVVQLWNRDDMQAEAELSEANGWQHTFTGLPKYTPGSAAMPSEPIEYWVEEVVPPDYEVEIAGDMDTGFTVTNTNAEKISIPMEKKWIGKTGPAVTVKLLADGAEKDSRELNAANSWKHTFADLPKYDSADGHEIVYTIQEVSVAGYTSVITGDASGYTVTNSYIPPVTPPPVTPPYDPISVPLSASKRLVNGALKDGQFAFELLAGNGKLIETASNDASGHIRFTDRRFSKTGTFIYTIREVKGDSAKITYDKTVYRVIVKITASGGRLSAKVDYEKDGVPYDGGVKFVNLRAVPSTGDSQLVLPLGLAVAAMAMFGGAAMLKRKKGRNQ